jgi:hypothetical protein
MTKTPQPLFYKRRVEGSILSSRYSDFTFLHVSRLTINKKIAITIRKAPMME